jgi:hypothetical protein
MGFFKAFRRAAYAHVREDARDRNSTGKPPNRATEIAWGAAKLRADQYLQNGKPLGELRGRLEEDGLLNREEITFVIRLSIQDHLRVHPELFDVFDSLPNEERKAYRVRVMEDKGCDAAAADAFARLWFTVGHLETQL